MGRLLLVSNRLPITANVERGRLTVHPSSGGLATALGAAHEAGESLWIGWPGPVPVLPASLAQQLETELSSQRLVGVTLARADIKGFYEQVANATLWPVLHSLLDNLPSELLGWEAYRAANERFAEAVAAQYQAGDSIWIHDYHLMLLPAMLRERLPLARIGYFHHVPFPAADVFRVLPWRAELLSGLLGADLVGFHTAEYARNFSDAVLQVLDAPTHDERIRFADCVTQVGRFPIGVDPQAWTELVNSDAAREETARYREELAGARLLVGVDRLDYTKGIVQRLLAFERVLECEPALRDQLRFVQVTVPSREQVHAYAPLKRRIDELVGRINGRFGTPHRMPVHRMHGHLEPSALAGLYRAADVMLVTPLRDGMNLVAKEFVAARDDGRGTLVLSEFAGAAEQLTGALIINPYDVDGLAATIRRALYMPEGEQRGRMLAMRARITEFDLNRWCSTFLDALGGVTARRSSSPAEPADESWSGDLPDFADLAVPV